MTALITNATPLSTVPFQASKHNVPLISQAQVAEFHPDLDTSPLLVLDGHRKIQIRPWCYYLGYDGEDMWTYVSTTNTNEANVHVEHLYDTLAKEDRTQSPAYPSWCYIPCYIVIFNKLSYETTTVIKNTPTVDHS